jgi:NADPH:quinone reductase-like Zn-dependent oxidoreductase
MFAIQLAHIAGYKVVTTASPKNHELCKSLGADEVFDVGPFPSAPYTPRVAYLSAVQRPGRDRQD